MLREYGLFLLFALPNIVIIAVFGLWPALMNLILSFTRWNFIAPTPRFVGLDNYVWVFTSPDFGRVAAITVIFAVVVVAVNMVLGLLLALLLNQKLRGRAVVRTLAFAPYVLSGAAVATIWLFLLDPNYGLMRVVFDLFGMTGTNWVTNSSLALPALIIVHIWKGVGFCAIVYLAALQSLPSDLYEAAEIDGAGPLSRFWYLTIPLLSRTTVFLFTIETINVTQAFDVIAVMTGGGPGGATTVLSWFIYQQGFQTFNVGRATAGAMILFIVLLGVFAIQHAAMRMGGRR